MGFDAGLELVMDGTNRKIVLQFLERLLDLDQLQIEPPEMAGIVAVDVGAQEIAAFAAPRGRSFLRLIAKWKVCGVTGWSFVGVWIVSQAIGLAGFFLGRAELEQQIVACQILRCNSRRRLISLRRRRRRIACSFSRRASLRAKT